MVFYDIYVLDFWYLTMSEEIELKYLRMFFSRIYLLDKSVLNLLPKNMLKHLCLS